MKNLETARESATQPEQAEQTVQSDSEINATETEEINGPKGPEPTRFGDWERKGRCVDF